MLIFTSLTVIALSSASLTISEPADGETYDGDWLTVRAIVENENELPDYVHYSLNGEQVIQIPRLNTNWYTYMQNNVNHGYSESPAPTDNTVLWTAPVTGTDHEFPTPVVVEGVVYYPSNYGTDSLYALDAATGELIWKYNTGYTDDAVTVRNGRLYTASDSLWCLDALTGEKFWATSLADASGSTPVATDDRVYAALWVPYTRDTSISCFDAETGTQIWVDTLPGRPVSCMALRDGMVFLPTFSEISESPLYALDANTGSVIWANMDSDVGYWDSSPVIAGNTVYIGGAHSLIIAIDVSTGQTVWNRDLSPGTTTATIAYHDERLYFAKQAGPYYCLDASTGNTFWSVPGRQHGSSCIADGIIFYGEAFYGDKADSARVIALDCENGSEIWSRTIASSHYGFQGSPSITDGVMYFPATDGNLYAFGTGLKYTYLDDLFTQVGANELIVTSFDDGLAVAADTINFVVTGTGIHLAPSRLFGLSVSPNPFRSSATISFHISESGYTSIQVFDLSGRIVSTIENSNRSSGQHSCLWSGRNQDGEAVSAGLYLCRIQSGETSETIGLCLLR